MRNRFVAFAGAVAVLSCAVFTGCAKKTSDGDGSESHFVACETDSRCASTGANYRCVEGQCKPTGGVDAGSGGANGNGGATGSSGAGGNGGISPGGAGGSETVTCPPSPHYPTDAGTDPPPSPPGFVDGGIYGCYPPRASAPSNWTPSKEIQPCPDTSWSCTYAPTALPCGSCQGEGSTCSMGVAAVCDCGAGPFVDTYDDQWTCKCENGSWVCGITGPSGASCQICSDLCANATPYSPGMVATGQSGVRVALVSAPEPPSLGNNTWTLTVSDPGGAPITGATITFYLFMPLHGHPGARNPVITEIGGGQYRADFVNFNMDGTWETTISVKKAPIDDSVVFELCAL